MCLAVKEDYEVLRLIEHDQVCYAGSECVKGNPLPRWIKFHPCIGKEELFRMADDIAGQLSGFHRCRGNPCYRYVNPYSIIVSEDGRARFLDINAVSNGGQLRIMQRRTVREHFLPPEDAYYQKASVELDIYGFGRTLQYLLSEAEVNPPLRKVEEARFQKIISKCLGGHSKKPFRCVSDIQKMIPVYRRLKKDGDGKRKLMIIGAGVFAVAGLTGVVISGFSARSNAHPSKVQEEVRSQGEQAAVKQLPGQPREQEEMQELAVTAFERHLYMKLGTVYFLELEDYGKSVEYFRGIEGDELAGHMAVVAEYFAGTLKQQEKLERALYKAEEELRLQSMEETSKVQDEEETPGVPGEGEATKPRGENSFGDEDGLREKAGLYLCILKGYAALEEDGETKGETAQRLSSIRTAGLEALLETAEADRRQVLLRIREQINEQPELEEDKEFKKVMRRYGIIVENGRVRRRQ